MDLVLAACGAGQFNNKTAQEDCDACPPGSFAAEDGSTACTACPSGGWCPDAGGSSRLVLRYCRAGTFNPDEGASTNTSCRLCNPGTANPIPGLSSSSACVACLPGSVAAAEGTAVCTRCEIGKYQSVGGQSACERCTRGYVCALGAIAPVPCPSGTHASQEVLTRDGFLSDVASHCVECSAGTHCPLGSDTPTHCAPGTFTNQVRQHTCVRCDEGMFQDLHGSTACKRCMPGQWCTASAAVPCGENKWNNQSLSSDQRDCRLCPPDSTTNGVVDATGPQGCVCETGFYKSADWTDGRPFCARCIVGTVCRGRGTTRHNLTLQRGYWRRSASSLDVRRCPDAVTNCSSSGRAICEHSTSACQGGAHDGAYCASGLTGPLCRLCNTSGFYYEPAIRTDVASCHSCGDYASRFVAIRGAVVAGVFILLISLYAMLRSAPLHISEGIVRYWRATQVDTTLKVRALREAKPS
jgi:hypothetical protein